jgi:hypothetical protein
MLFYFSHHTPVHQLAQRNIFRQFQSLLGELHVETDALVGDDAVVGICTVSARFCFMKRVPRMVLPYSILTFLLKSYLIE